ncbi:hypothetical protein WA026_016634 [Henosepilachna vigintioctopunctata]|uniref:Uncharacterized protein n=1 Tax=Henosepilachna vigintioctopunctata TaxID=420089 RepID=A0AAW1VAX9_9CUCU
MMSNDKPPAARWSSSSLDRLSLRGVMDQAAYKEQQMVDSYKHGIQLDNSHNFPNNPAMPSYLQMGTIRNQDYVQVPSWDANSRQNTVDDKAGWPVVDWKR